MKAFHLARTHPGAYLAVLLLFVSLACSLPFVSQTQTPLPPAQDAATVTPGPTPTPLPPLPPALVESDPFPGERLPLQGPLTLYFNQPMDRPSVEAALAAAPELDGRLVWRDESTLAFIPETQLAPDQALSLTVGIGARAANGLALPEPVELSFQTAGFLNVSQALPEPGSQAADPAGAIMATFNQPVVALGADPQTMPSAFRVFPEAGGTGEWINTSTYMFLPEPPLAGGTIYVVRLNPDLRSTDGGPLAQAQGEAAGLEWSFATARPELVSINPLPDAQTLPLDTAFELRFNQPMDSGSVAANLLLRASDGLAQAGGFEWNEDFSLLTFTPETQLARGETYSLSLDGAARTRGGTPLGQTLTFRYTAVPPLVVTRSDPGRGGSLVPFASLEIGFSGPIQAEAVDQWVSFDPPVAEINHFWDPELRLLRLWGQFEPDQEYTLNLSPALSDPWGGELGQLFSLPFRTRPLDPDLTLIANANAFLVTPEDPRLAMQVTNLARVDLTLGSLSLEDFIQLQGPGGYERLQSFQPPGSASWSQPVEALPNRSTPTDLGLRSGGGELATGLYFLRLNAPGLRFQPGPFFVVASRAHLAYKLSATDALVWAVDLGSNRPIPGAPVALYDEAGMLLARGETDGQGVFRSPVPVRENPFSNSYAVLGQPGEPDFGLALAGWDQGVAGWDFGIATDFTPPGLEVYLYTDRPIYRPGQTVFFRGVARWAFNGRYDLPDVESLSLTVGGERGQELATLNLPLSPYGTFHGDYTLPQQAVPGYYRLGTEFGEVTFQVAEFRKPEIDLQIGLAPEQSLSGQGLTGTIQADFFFGAPAGEVPVEWSLFASPEPFHLPGYQVGSLDDGWLYPFWLGLLQPFGEFIESGEAQTGPDGSLEIALTPPQKEGAQRYTLEVTARDESGLPVSGRASAVVHPSPIYIGLRPQSWVGQAGQAIGFDVQLVDWDQAPVGEHSLLAEFSRVVWERQAQPSADPYQVPEFVPRYTLIERSTFSSDLAGRAELGFTPPEPGTYQLDVSGGGARSQILVWVGGRGQAQWPALPNQQLRLTADQESYQPGDQAQIFIPNPFGRDAQALVTVERGVVLRHELVTMGETGAEYLLNLGAEAAPNVFVSVTVLGRNAENIPDFRYGLIDLPVAPLEQVLQVELAPDPVQAEPGDRLTVGLLVSDKDGNPVQGEFSLAVVDRATLALAEPNSAAIVNAFYDTQPLGVRTGLGLVAFAQRQVLAPPGVGGGGGGDLPATVVREEFPDTAFWSAQIETDSAGRAQVAIELPDNLTTWELDLRGLTREARVGQAVGQVVVSKELLVRPATPRFLVAGDRLELAAVVQNNTGEPLAVEVGLQAEGVLIDPASARTQSVQIPGGGRVRVAWPVTVLAGDGVDAVFTARASDSSGRLLQDAARPAQGSLPVRAFSATQTFGTSGVLDSEGARLELVSLPRSFEALGANLQVELSPSLAGALFESLAALEDEPYESIEHTLSRFLPNLETLRAVQVLGLDAPALQARLERTLAEGVERLTATQNPDGGWSWWPRAYEQEPFSDPFVSAYALFGLARVSDAGVVVDAQSLQRAIEYQRATLVRPEMLSEDWQLDRLAFQHFALAEAGSGDVAGALALYESRARLNPWARAMLALALEQLAPGDQRAADLFSALQAEALRSGTGAHWELAHPSPTTMSTPLSNTAMVAFALARRDPASPLLAEVTRFLMAHRSPAGAWGSSFDNAWTVMAASGVVQGTGEMGGDFVYAATLNESPIAEGSVQASPALNPAEVVVASEALRLKAPNTLEIGRGPGPGRLYYRSLLEVDQPAETAASSQRGLSVERTYYPTGAACLGGACDPIDRGKAGELVEVRLSLALEKDAHFLVVEDALPAGGEVLDTSLRTSQLAPLEALELGALFDPRNPLAQGWGWWYFSPPQIFDDRIAWAAEFLPAGSYELRYFLVLLHTGEYRVLPAQAAQVYFPEVAGRSAGSLFTIQPE